MDKRAWDFFFFFNLCLWSDKERMSLEQHQAEYIMTYLFLGELTQKKVLSGAVMVF